MTDEFPVPVRSVVTTLDDASYAQHWQQPLTSAGSLLLEADLDGVSDTAALLARVAAGLDASTHVPVGTWSGLEDYLRQRVATWERPGATIVLRRVDGLARDDLGALLELMAVLRDLVTAAESDAQNFPRDVAVRIVITGSGPSFPADG